YLCFLLTPFPVHCCLHSFPTRRSSDLSLCQRDNMTYVTNRRLRLQVEVECVMIDSSQQRDIVETENIMHYAIARKNDDFVTVINEKNEKYSDIDSLINHVLSFDESAVFIRDDRMVRDENGEIDSLHDFDSM